MNWRDPYWWHLLVCSIQKVFGQPHARRNLHYWRSFINHSKEVERLVESRDCQQKCPIFVSMTIPGLKCCSKEVPTSYWFFLHRIVSTDSRCLTSVTFGFSSTPCRNFKKTENVLYLLLLGAVILVPMSSFAVDASFPILDVYSDFQL